MKHVISFIAILVTLGVTIPTPKVEYKVSLVNVTNVTTAKDASKYLKKEFSEEPEFDDSSNTFTFESVIRMEEPMFRNLSDSNGYTVLKFDRTNK